MRYCVSCSTQLRYCLLWDTARLGLLLTDLGSGHCAVLSGTGTVSCSTQRGTVSYGTQRGMAASAYGPRLWPLCGPIRYERYHLLWLYKDTTCLWFCGCQVLTVCLPVCSIGNSLLTLFLGFEILGVSLYPLFPPFSGL